MQWIENISQAIEYIEDNLEEDICLEQAAKLANCSLSHFQKVFSYITDLTISEYIRRRRMTLAGFELKRKKGRVIDIANKYGYTSPTAFNRAFKSIHGISPSKAMDSQSTLNSYSPIKFSIQMLGGERMSYKIEDKSNMRVVGVRIPLTYEMEQDMQTVPKFWNTVIVSETYNTLCEIAQSPFLYGITDSTNKSETYYYIAVETKESVPENMKELDIPATKRVIFENSGRFKETVQLTFKRFLLEWLPFSNYVYDGSPDIEVYPLKPETKQEGYSEIWISIKEEK